MYAAAGLFPFGQNTLAWGDMSQQALPFLLQFKTLAGQGQGLFWSMANAGGMNFWGVFLYFLCSPFSLLALLAPAAALGRLANLLVALKILLAACAATAFFASPATPWRTRAPLAGLLGLMYAFGGYTLMFYQNLVWLDQVILFPLLVLAWWRLVKEEKWAGFCLLLALSLWGQFQIGLLVLLAVLLFSGVYVLLYTPREEQGALCLRLGLAALPALLLAGAALVPAAFQFSRSARGEAPLDALRTADLAAPIATTLPVLLCTAMVFAALAFLLRAKGPRRPETLYALTCFALFCIPLLVEPVNLMWHGGSYQAFPCRFGFITLLFGLMPVAAAFGQVDGAGQADAPAKRPAGAAAKSAAALALYGVGALAVLLFFQSEATVYTYTLSGDGASLAIGGLLCLLAGAAGYYALWAARGPRKRRALLLLGLLVGLECGVNSWLYIGAAANPGVEAALMLELAGQPVEGRVKLSRKYTEANMTGAMGYDALGHYSSFTRREAIEAGKKLGYSGYWMEMTGLGGTELSDGFLHVSAALCQRDSIDPLYNKNRTIAENARYALVETGGGGAYGLLAAAAPEALQTIPGGDRFAAQQWLYQTVYGADDEAFLRYAPTTSLNVSVQTAGAAGETTLTPEDGGMGLLTYSLDIDEPQTLYFDCFYSPTNRLKEPVNGAFSVIVNDVYIESLYPSASSNGLLCLGSFENERVDIRLELYKPVTARSFGVVGLRLAAVETARALANPVEVAVRGGRVTAQVAQAGEGQLLLLALGYDEGFTARVNGEKAEVLRLLDGYMGLVLHEGANTVELTFVPRGFWAGLGLSLLGGVWFAARGLGRRFLPRRGARPSPAGAGALPAGLARGAMLLVFSAAMIIVYLLPLLIWLLGKIFP